MISDNEILIIKFTKTYA